MITPMLPDAYAPHKIIYPILIQPKLTGQRTLYQNGVFEPDHDGLRGIAIRLREILPERLVLDGVIKDGIYTVFDVVSYKIPYKERFDSIAQILHDSHYRHPVKVILTRKMFNATQDDAEFFVWKHMYPGVIYRLGHCFYTKPTKDNKFNRSKQLLLRHATDCPTSTDQRPDSAPPNAESIPAPPPA
jgi:hypothetical protein